jgi:hypothetical protein
MKWSLRLWRLVGMIENVQVELERLIRDMETEDEWFGGFAHHWLRDLREADELLEEAKETVSRVAADIERGKRIK